MQSIVGFSPKSELVSNGGNQVFESRKISVMNAKFSSQLPDSLNRTELRTIRRQKIQPQIPPVIPQPGLQQSGMMISGVIQNNHHLLVGRALGSCGNLEANQNVL